MNTLKKIGINILNTVRIFFTNLRRNFIKELLVGIGIIFGVSILIVSTTLADGFERLIRNSILGQINYEEIKIKGMKLPSGEDSIITYEQMIELESFHGVENVYPLTDIPFQISAIMKIPVINRRTLMGLVGNGVPKELADPHIEKELTEKFFPNGFEKTLITKGDKSYEVTPVLFSNFIYEAIGTFLEAEGLGGLDLRSFLVNGYEFQLRMGKSMFQATSIEDTIIFPNGKTIDTEGIDKIINDHLNKNFDDYAPQFKQMMEDEKQHPALKFKAGKQIGSDGVKIAQLKEDLDDDSLGGIKLDTQKLNPYRIDNYVEITEDNLVERCMFVGSAPINITFTMSLPLRIVQAYKMDLQGEDYREGYDTVLITTSDASSVKLKDQLEGFFAKYNFREDEQFKTLRGVTKVVNDAVTSLRSLVIGLGILILLLSAVAIFYSFMYIINRRSKEIGLYRFFGATRGKVITLLVLESAFVGLVCSSIAYFFSLWLITDFLPANFDYLLENLSEDFTTLIFSSGSEFTKELSFSNIFRFDYTRSQLFLWLGVIISMISSLIPAIKGSYTSLFKTINS